MGVIEGSELPGAAVQVDETRTKRRQETKTVINCKDTKWTVSSTINTEECGTMKMGKRLIK